MVISSSQTVTDYQRYQNYQNETMTIHELKCQLSTSFLAQRQYQTHYGIAAHLCPVVALQI
jgi:hypothetical protein